MTQNHFLEGQDFGRFLQGRQPYEYVLNTGVCDVVIMFKLFSVLMVIHNNNNVLVLDYSLQK